MRAVPPQQQRRSLALHLPSGFLQKHTSHPLSPERNLATLFVTFSSSVSVLLENKRQRRSLTALSLSPLFFDVPLLSRSANSFTTWKTRYRVNKGKRKVEERSSGYFSTIDSSNGVEARLVRARSNLSVGLENSSFLIRSILSWYLFITLSLCIVDYFLFGEKRERKWGMQSGRNADMFSFIANWEGMFELRRKGKPNREENFINKNKIVLQYSRIERSSSKINW